MIFADPVKLGDEIPKDMKPVLRGQMKDYPKSEIQPQKIYNSNYI